MWKEIKIPLIVKNIRPLIFLCGPFFNKENRFDRRNILRSYIGSFKRKDEFEPFALIIDNLFAENTRNLPLLEEIIAECSEKIYIFLDTMSASLELGLFSSAYKENNVTVFLPKDYQFFKPSIGPFVKNSLEESKSVKLVQYQNRRYNILREAGNEKITYENFIGFKKNKLPHSIASVINSDMCLIEKNNICIDFDLNKQNKKKIGVTVIKDYVEFVIPTDILLYLIFNSNDIKDVETYLIELFLKYNTPDGENYKVYYMYKKGLLKINLQTYFNYPFENVYDEIKAMLMGIAKDVSGKSYTYLQYNVQLKSLNTNAITLKQILGISKKNNLLINSYLNKPSKFLEKKTIVIKGKKRRIISYKGNSFGNELRKFHESLVSHLLDYFKFSDNAYGYIKGKSIQQCLEKHRNDNYFVKVDVKNFFNSISKAKLNSIFRILISTQNIDEAKSLFISNNKKVKLMKLITDFSGYQKILSCCCYYNKVPLGFSSSPTLSNIYMILFDALLEEDLKDLHYSRYADDILISSDKKIDNIAIIRTIENKLSYFDLKLNEKKIHFYHLKKSGDHIKFLGINIIKCINENKLTIGHKYLMNTSKMLCDYLNYNGVSKEKVVGCIEFIKFSSDNSYDKLLKIIKVKMNIDFDIEKFKKSRNNQ
ncbi:MAG: reverse transcriptase domain-containing protein [Bacilli bacterium]